MSIQPDFSNQHTAEIISPFWPEKNLDESGYINAAQTQLTQASEKVELAGKLTNQKVAMNNSMTGKMADASQKRMEESIAQAEKQQKLSSNAATTLAMGGQNIYNTKNMLNQLSRDHSAKHTQLTALSMTNGAPQHMIVAARKELDERTRAAAAAIGGGFRGAHNALNENLERGTRLSGAPPSMVPALQQMGTAPGWGNVPGMPTGIDPTGMSGLGGAMNMAAYDGTPGSLINTALSSAPAISQLAQTGLQVGDQVFNHLQQAAYVATGAGTGAMDALQEYNSDASDKQVAENGKTEEGKSESAKTQTSGAGGGGGSAGGSSPRGSGGGSISEQSGVADQTSDDESSADDSDNAKDSDDSDSSHQKEPSSTASESEKDLPDNTLEHNPDTQLSGGETHTSSTSTEQVSTHTTGGASVGTAAPSAAGAGAGGMGGFMPMGAMGGAMGGMSQQNPGSSKLHEPKSTAGLEAVAAGSVLDDIRGSTKGSTQASFESDLLDHLSPTMQYGFRVASSLWKSVEGTASEGPIALAVYKDKVIYNTADLLGFPRKSQVSLPARVTPLYSEEKLTRQFRFDWAGAKNPTAVLCLASELGFIDTPEGIISVGTNPLQSLPPGTVEATVDVLEQITQEPIIEGSLLSSLPSLDIDTVKRLLPAAMEDWGLPDLSVFEESDVYQSVVQGRWDHHTSDTIRLASLIWLIVSASEALSKGNSAYAAIAGFAILGLPSKFI